MSTTNETVVTCSACGQPFPAQVYAYIDVVQAPQGKAQLLNGSLNNFPCPNCGTVNTVATPLLYHDPTKELLVAHVPMELNMQKDEQERVIGQLMNRMPKDNFKGYMFNPKRAFTLQGLTELVLEADGVTKEMIEEQKQRVQLVQQFIEVESEEALDKLIQEHDDKINEQFLNTMSLIAQRMMEGGQQQAAQQIAGIQQLIINKSKFGDELRKRQEAQTQVIESVAKDIENLGQNAGRAQFLDLALKYNGQDDHLQALVGLVRPVFDEDFFKMMTLRIGEAPANDREKLEALRNNIVNMTASIDQQQQLAMQQAANFLQSIVNHPTPREALMENIDMVDDLFMQILQANIQQAEQQSNLQLLTRLKQIQQVAYEVLQSQMQPELRFVNDLLGMSEAEAEKTVKEQAANFGPELIEVIDAVHSLLAQQGNIELQHRLEAIKKLVMQTTNS